MSRRCALGGTLLGAPWCSPSPPLSLSGGGLLPPIFYFCSDVRALLMTSLHAKESLPGAVSSMKSSNTSSVGGGGAGTGVIGMFRPRTPHAVMDLGMDLD